jgi:cation transport ATPase
MTVCTINISDMHCSACAAKISRVSESLADVQNMHINLVRRQILLEHSDSETPMELLLALEGAGFSPSVSGETDHDKEQRQLLKRLGVAGLACMHASYDGRHRPLRWRHGITGTGF